MDKHTPGPWNISPPCELSPRYSVYHNGPLVYVERGEDARLIAAAPDLLELARQIVLAVEQGEGSIPTDIVNGARAAITKATGESK